MVTHAVLCCANLTLSGLPVVDPSPILEVSHVQRCVSYLAIRVHHYLRFLPDQSVFDAATMRPSDDDETSSDDDNTGAAAFTDAFSPEKQRQGNPLQAYRARSLKLSHPPARRKTIRSRASTRTTKTHRNTWSIEVNVFYEPKGCNDRAALDEYEEVLLGDFADMKGDRVGSRGAPMVSFTFHHNPQDPVLRMLTKEVRVALKERPGEVLLLFAYAPVASVSPTGSRTRQQDLCRQLITDEDVLFLFDAQRLKAVSENSRTPSIDLLVRRGSSSDWIPLIIGVGTMLSVSTRLALSIQKLADPSTSVQVLGLLLLCCLVMQLAQNSIITAYLVRRFRSVDDEFDTWYADSGRDVAFASIFSVINVSNLSLLGCHVRITEHIRLDAPIGPKLESKIVKYSLVGFIIGDLLPFVFILIFVILEQQYNNLLVVLSTLFSVASVAGIMIMHGVFRFVVLDAVKTKEMTSKAAHGISGAQLGKSLLCKKEVTLVRVHVTGEHSLLDFLHVERTATVIRDIYACLKRHLETYGGFTIEATGLGALVAFNAERVVPDHATVALEFFKSFANEVEHTVLQKLFLSDEIRRQVAAHLPSERNNAQGLVEAMSTIHQRHKVVGGMFTAEAAVGYVGTLTTQLFQVVGYPCHVATALAKMAEWYRVALVCSSASIDRITQNNVLHRYLDTFTLTSALFSTGAPNLDAASALEVPLDAPVVECFEILLAPLAADETTETLAMPKHGHVNTHTTDLVREYNDAVEILTMLHNKSPLASYVKDHPEDTVAARVWQWMQYRHAANEAEALHFPRLLSYLGLSRHPCESKGEKITIQSTVSEQRASAATAALHALKEKLREREKLLRPPRSKRRVQAAGSSIDAFASSAVAETIMTSSKFHIDFK
jgi:class 3 adenylate cyclase